MYDYLDAKFVKEKVEYAFLYLGKLFDNLISEHNN